MTDGEALGLSDTAIGLALGNVLGLKLGEFEGLLEGVVEGLALGNVLGPEGLAEGLALGDVLGLKVRKIDGGFVTMLLIGGILMVGDVLGDRVDSSQSGFRQTNSPLAAGLPVLVVSPLLKKWTSTKLFVTLSMRCMESTDQQPSYPMTKLLSPGFPM